jgi:hypothetical protein
MNRFVTNALRRWRLDVELPREEVVLENVLIAVSETVVVCIKVAKR